MTSPVTQPDYEMTRRLVEVFSADSALQSLLYPEWASPKQGPNDTRIYGAHADIRDIALLTILPRVIIDLQLLSNNWEQEDEDTNSAPVEVHIHSFAPKDQYDTAEKIDSRIRTIISSTYLTNSRIIASELVQNGPKRRSVETRFEDAWRLTTGYKAENVGVIA